MVLFIFLAIVVLLQILCNLQCLQMRHILTITRKTVEAEKMEIGDLLDAYEDAIAYLCMALRYVDITLAITIGFFVFSIFKYFTS